jgi:nitrite reductase/ring-hydroxylating ferredoxin subunit
VFALPKALDVSKRQGLFSCSSNRVRGINSYNVLFDLKGENVTLQRFLRPLLFGKQRREDRMNKIFVSKLSEMKDGACQLVSEGKLEIGVYRRGADFYAYKNLCVHQGGPACQGITMHKVEEVIRVDKTSAGMRFNKDEEHIVCPWHSFEYDIKTGVCVADKKLKLKKFEVVTEGDSVYVLA